MTIQPVVFGLAVGSLACGIALFLYSAIVQRYQQFHAVNVICWLLIALFPVLVLFSLFPSSQVKGTIAGWSMTGAFGGFVFIWIYGTRVGLNATNADRRRAEEQARIKELEQQLRLAKAQNKPRVLTDSRRYPYRTKWKPRKTAGLISGNLGKVTGIDVWVNSENTNMQMAGFFDRSVSGLIRYLGAKRSDSGAVKDDLVGNALLEAVGGAIGVVPGKVFVTGPGELGRTHGVKRILHVAAVQGEPGMGYRPIGDIGSCVEHVLARMDEESESGDPLRTVVFPLLGVGQGHGDIGKTFRILLTAALDYLAQHPGSVVEEVYFMAYTDNELAVCEKILESSDRLSRLRTAQRARS